MRKKIGRVFGTLMLLGGFFIASGVFVESAQARCCDVAGDGCSNASENGCAMGSPFSMFFPDPCECQQSGLCQEDGGGACGGGGGGGEECGDGNVDSGEDCDDGDENGTFMSCCAVDCSYKSNGAICDDGVFCDGLGACDGSGTCDANAGGETCPDPARCDEESRSCNEAAAPTASTPVLFALATMMLLGATLILRRRRHNQI